MFFNNTEYYIGDIQLLISYVVLNPMDALFFVRVGLFFIQKLCKGIHPKIIWT